MWNLVTSKLRLATSFKNCSITLAGGVALATESLLLIVTAGRTILARGTLTTRAVSDLARTSGLLHSVVVELALVLGADSVDARIISSLAGLESASAMLGLVISERVADSPMLRADPVDAYSIYG